jgi:hypothetical protein
LIAEFRGFFKALFGHRLLQLLAKQVSPGFLGPGRARRMPTSMFGMAMKTIHGGDQSPPEMAIALRTPQMRLLLKLLPTDVAAGTGLLSRQIGLHQSWQEHLLQGAEHLNLSGTHFAEGVRMPPLIVDRSGGGAHLTALAVHPEGFGTERARPFLHKILT